MNKKIRIIICTIGLLIGLSACSSDTQSTAIATIEPTESTQVQTSYSSDDLNTEEFTNRDLDFSYVESEAINVTLSDNQIFSDSKNITIENNTVTINEEGIYVFTGSLSNGQIIVDADIEAKVQIVLNNVEIINENLSPIYVKQANKVFVSVLDDTTNVLTTLSSITIDEDTKIDGVIFSENDLVINGSGTLNISSSENGIVSKDDLKICNANLNIVAGNNGLEANDSIRVSGANINIEAAKDGLKVGDDLTGYIYIASGSIEIIAENDGMHATANITIDDGSIKIDEASEGIEAAVIMINGGNIDINSSDDGFNASSDTIDEILLEINDGAIFVNANGDGLDSNGDLIINGGQLYIIENGDANGAIDYNGTGTINGGSIIAIGSSDRLQGLESTTQGTILTTVTENGNISLSDSSNNAIINLNSDSSYQAVFVSSEFIKLNGTYILTTGDTSTNIEMTTLNYSYGVSDSSFSKKGK